MKTTGRQILEYTYFMCCIHIGKYVFVFLKLLEMYMALFVVIYRLYIYLNLQTYIFFKKHLELLA